MAKSLLVIRFIVQRLLYDKKKTDEKEKVQYQGGEFGAIYKFGPRLFVLI